MVSIILSKKGIVPPIEWLHDPNITDRHGFTVEDYLLLNRMEVP